jgi:hypothetical protein
MNALIDAALIGQLKTTTNLPPLQEENQAHLAKGTFVRAKMIKATPDALTIGANGRDLHSNTMRVDVFVPVNTGSETANNIADTIIASFPKGLRLTAGDYFIHITRAYRTTALRMNDQFHSAPVNVDFKVIV